MHGSLAFRPRGSLVAACAALLFIAACSKKEEAPPRGGACRRSNALEGQVDIVAWAGYIERGETDKAYDWSPSSRRTPAARST